MVRERTSFDGRTESDRGVSEVIGSILVFGLVIALLALVQTQVVPNANEGVEASHSTDVRGDMTELQSAISRSATLGGSESVSVKTGMTYPQRLVLYNPPPVQGTLSTGDTETATLNNFIATDTDTADYLDGSSKNFDTHRIRYRVDYNRYENAPTTKYEHGVLVDDFGEKTIVKNKGALVDGNRISLTLLGGGLQESSVQQASVSTYPVSAPAQTVSVETDSTAVGEIRVRTTIDEEVWVSQILGGQIDPEAAPDPGDDPTCANVDLGGSSPKDDNRYIVNCVYNSGSPNEITLRFEKDQTYKLRMAKVGFSAVSDKPEAGYVTKVGPTSKTVEPGGSTELTVEVRDKFSNPRGDVPVTAKITSGSGSLASSSTKESGSDGRVTYTYNAPAGSTSATVELEIQGSSVPEKQVTFQVNSGNPGDTDDPVFASFSGNARELQVCDSFSSTSVGGVGGAVVCTGTFVFYDQAVVNYEIYDPDPSGTTPSGLDHVTFTVVDGSGNVLSSSSREFADGYVGSGNSYTGRYTSPYIDRTDGASEVIIRVYDNAGRVKEKRVTL